MSSQSDSHRCPIEGCERRVPPHQLMCPRHWRAVPHDVRRRLYRAWDNGCGRGTEEHDEAMMAAIHAAEVDGDPPAAPRALDDQRGWSR